MDLITKKRKLEASPTLISNDVVSDEIMECQTKLKRVPVFVLFVEDEDIGQHAMEFYAFHESMLCPIFELNTSPFDNSTQKGIPVQDVSFRARPFTGFNSCPEGCSFASAGGQLYLVGGDRYSSHVTRSVFEDPKKGEALQYPVSDVSSRVLRFDCQQFVNSLAENKGKGKIKFAELDNDDQVSHDYWETCKPLSIPRIKASLLHLDGKLWAVGGIYGYTNGDPLIEVFEDGVWTPLEIPHPEGGIHAFGLVSVALEDAKKILIGSNGKFYKLDIRTNQWETVVGLECPEILVDRCYADPGFVVHNTYAIWYDNCDYCIRGLDLCSNKHFHVELMDYVLPIEHKHYSYGQNGQNAKLIDMQDEEGSLCLIYYGNLWFSAINDRGVKYIACEYHFVTFQIVFNDKIYATAENISFPGLKLEPRVISRRKCYAPALWDLGAAFAMDVCLP